MLQTPNLDTMAASGLVFDRFYDASSVCSPTRGSLLTGRDPYRYGILTAHTGGMRTGELTIAEALKKNGYATGFFGKWHIGYVKPSHNSTKGHYSPPWFHGFDESFATYSIVPTWNPTVTPKGWNKWGQTAGTPWKGGPPPYVRHDSSTNGWGQPVTKNMQGDDSRIIMDRAVPFIQQQVQKKQPFLAVIWFHTPHEPVVAGPQYRALYSNLDSLKQNYYGAITAMDEQVCRLCKKLRQLGVAGNTFVMFTSDNGTSGPVKQAGAGSTGPFRGHKHTMYDGGVHVPAVMEWPGHIPTGHTDALAGTVDFMPTVLDLGELKAPKAFYHRPIDGVNLRPVLFGDARDSWNRPTPIKAALMRLYYHKNGAAVVGNRYKLVDPVDADTYELYDLRNDPGETNNIAGERPDILRQMKQSLQQWRQSTRRSRDGADYTY